MESCLAQGWGQLHFSIKSNKPFNFDIEYDQG